MAAQSERVQAERDHALAVARNELESMQIEVESLAAQRAKWAAEHESEERCAAEERAAREEMEAAAREALDAERAAWESIKSRGEADAAAAAEIKAAAEKLRAEAQETMDAAVAKAHAADASKNFLKSKETAVARAEEDLKRRAARREKEDAAQIEAMEAMRVKLDVVEAREAAAGSSRVLFHFSLFTFYTPRLHSSVFHGAVHHQ